MTSVPGPTLMEPPPLIELRAVRKIYGTGETEVRALDGVNLRVEDGEFVAILGASGSGKSTCMNILGCLDAPTSGEYLFRGANVGGLSRNQLALLRRAYIGFVFQGFNLLKRTTALENVELPLIYRGWGPARRRAKAAWALERVGLADRATHTSAELSGGQQQRVAIARALAMDPAVLLADEPTGNLDSARGLEIMRLLRQLNIERGLTILLVTHELDIAAFAGRHVHFRDGQLVRDEANAQRAE